jgi:MoxR-like ATPase
VIDLVLAAFAAGGHVLLEDLPGTGKTVLAKSLARSMDLIFSRIQFTPDLLPSDVTGLSYFDQSKNGFVFREGPVFANVLLADEINRATPRTQSALLECMGEGQVTVDGETRRLKEPFFVIATQNPVETLGCFPLPEAQLDRFLMKLSIGRMSREEERRMLDRFNVDEPLETLKPVADAAEVLSLREECRKVFVHGDLRDYIVALTQSTRQGEGAEGASPRGTLSLLRASQGYALVQGRAYVVPEDIKEVAIPVLAHRIITDAVRTGEREDRIRMLLDKVPVPTEDWSAR